MDKKRGSWVAFLTLAAGILLLFLQGTAIDIIIMVFGGILTALSVINIVTAFIYGRKQSDGEIRGELNIGRVLTSLVVLVFGIWMLVSPIGISTLVVYFVAGLMILGGLYHVMMLGFGFKNVRFPIFFYILPIILVIGGVTVLAIGVETVKSVLALLAGISLIVFALSMFSEIGGQKHYSRSDS